MSDAKSLLAKLGRMPATNIDLKDEMHRKLTEAASAEGDAPALTFDPDPAVYRGPPGDLRPVKR